MEALPPISSPIYKYYILTSHSTLPSLIHHLATLNQHHLCTSSRIPANNPSRLPLLRPQTIQMPHNSQHQPSSKYTNTNSKCTTVARPVICAKDLGAVDAGDIGTHYDSLRVSGGQL